MIGKLKGLVDSFGDDWVLIDCGGVCYEVFCSGRTLQALPRVGEAAVVFIETIVREDLIRLYGFASDAEKSWFNLLTTVQGVGPKLAVRIVTELKGKVPTLGAVDAGTLGLQVALGEGIAASNVSDAVSALTNLGYSSAQASAALAKVVGREGDDTPTEKLIRLGLRELSQ